jgi:hypothetical protein
MRKTVIATAVLLFLPSAFAKCEELRRRLTSAELLAAAVANLERRCVPTTALAIEDSNGRFVDVPSKQKKGEAEKVSVPILFREGRFKLEPPRPVFLDNRSAMIVKFLPVQEIFRLDAKEGEDSNKIRGMNLLSGEVFIDPATGSIMRAEGVLTEDVSYLAGIITVTSAKFVFTQRHVEGKWLPEKVTNWVKLNIRFYPDEHRRYTTTFDCYGVL